MFDSTVNGESKVYDTCTPGWPTLMRAMYGFTTAAPNVIVPLVGAITCTKLGLVGAVCPPPVYGPDGDQ